MRTFIKAALLPAMVLFLASCGSQPKSEKPVIDESKLVEHVYLTTIHCDGCVNTVQTRMPENEGIDTAIADLATRQVTVRFDTSITDDAAIIAAFEFLGYEASRVDASAPVEATADTLPATEQPEGSEMDVE